MSDLSCGRWGEHLTERRCSGTDWSSSSSPMRGTRRPEGLAASLPGRRPPGRRADGRSGTAWEFGDVPSGLSPSHHLRGEGGRTARSGPSVTLRRSPRKRFRATLPSPLGDVNRSRNPVVPFDREGIRPHGRRVLSRSQTCRAVVTARSAAHREHRVPQCSAHRSVVSRREGAVSRERFAW